MAKIARLRGAAVLAVDFETVISDERKPKDGYSFGSGTKSQVSWQNPDVQNALRSLFNCKPQEILAAIMFTEEGIIAHIERRKE